ncbi:triple tyrosine motif-containing protein [Draconibacterium sp. IB214405]|uniref:helix-turn-helix and ligand-binding sensor domain-containing protein n=1 Tax=Draconibacterium sp. IB214405 TaxID=3097352 RepID=UPI002A161222|nr:triple tyrosine motif-containing protein [Draconibacterium sp. IB214405]MDX8338999.1 triple tyrosine motif-containing protein [Draconibacterium sp. IB214405]
MNVTKTIIGSIFLVVLAITSFALEEETGVLKFDQNIYKGARQNWSVSIAGNGVVYFANHKGLLSFDGTNWTMNKMPNNTIVRSVNAVADSVVYAGGYRELGFWKPTPTGELVYTSLNQKAEAFLEADPNMEFWNIAVKDDYVYFQSFSNILTYHNDSIYRLHLDGGISVMNQIGDRILVSVRNNGIWEVENDDVKRIIFDDVLIGTTVKFIIPADYNNLLIGTADRGIFIWDGSELKQWNDDYTSYFIDNEVNRACRNKNGQYIIGSLVDGIVIFDRFGQLISKVNSRNGLPNNTVLGIASDERQNTWLALDIGLGFVSGRLNKSFVVKKLPGAGAIYSTAVFENKLYLGTNQGLFESSLDLNNNEIKLVPGTQDQIWDLKVIDDELLIGHNSGSFALKNGEKRVISAEGGAFNFVQDPFHPELLLQSTYNRILVYNKTSEGIQFRNYIADFSNLIRYIEFDHLGNIWASHMHRGIFKIHVNDERTEKIEDTEYYGEDTFGKDHSIHVFKIEKRIVFTTGEKLYTFDDLTNSIIPYDTLNANLGEYAAANRIIKAPNNYYWFIGTSSIGLFYIVQSEVKLVKEFPTSLFNDPLLVDGFENILPINEYTGILCLQNGLAFLDAAVSDSTTNLMSRYSPSARSIELQTNNGRSVFLPLSTSKTEIKNTLNNLKFRFSFPLLNEFPVSYKYFLAGLNQQWSGNIADPEFQFERLPRGDYQLQVKAIDIWGNESQVYTFDFKILPPLLATKVAIFLYMFILIGALLLFRRWGVKQTQKKEQLQHEKRERELIRLRNDKLRGEVRFKSKELANSTMAIIRKNEFLIDLKNIVRKQKEELGSRYPDKYYNYLNNKIDENISSRDDRQIFESNFERAHEQFFQKMKNKYPDLTSSDLQLCAYLRMNLSSKEIAPLLGISIRGVENHRYKLRKKLRLEPEDSLTDVMFSI